MKNNHIMSIIFILIAIILNDNNNYNRVVGSILSTATSTLDCHDVFMGHFTSGVGVNKNLQITVINPNGVVSISRDSISYIENGNYITNVKLFPTIFSNNEHCIRSQSQLFNPSQKKISFGDRNGIIINPNGVVSYKPIWSTVGEFKFNISCEKNLYYGVEQKALYFNYIYK
ncbi:hypothetical protein DICPUDRAFT_79918 [Dictyostelium purpureum]|uniref:Carbohydrate binding domain-containing protein n=1 Tax=Dictyostelium purpureum TaxID=5786 RepID=F0ZP10_DICPU|nr:uncharacterized protein DICPUDRAFT_79918 [Dictyostelium purpureum]EGC34315.1 hypothetical protein DICPUDRAFT_79918 [Dictyostelium purpureum]|eukprot:XP_003289151.1 hypothetical protein DICPUDRAFT_79918 [Dictyostelium purpureum]